MVEQKGELGFPRSFEFANSNLTQYHFSIRLYTSHQLGRGPQIHQRMHSHVRTQAEHPIPESPIFGIISTRNLPLAPLNGTHLGIVPYKLHPVARVTGPAAEVTGVNPHHDE